MLDPRILMISFDALSFFIRVPVREAMSFLGRHFEEDILRLFHHVLTSSYFSFAGQFTNKLTVQMWVHLSPVIANFFTEDFSKKMAFHQSTLKPCADSFTWMTLLSSSPMVLTG
jgi:hypothetical protein